MSNDPVADLKAAPGAIISEYAPHFTARPLGAAVAGKFADFSEGVHGLMASAEQRQADRAELAARRVYLTPSGWTDAEQQSKAATEESKRSNTRKASQALQELDAELVSLAVPKVSGDEKLARDHVQTILGGSRDGLEDRVRRLAGGANRDAAAALVSPWGADALEAAGLDENAAREVHSMARGWAADAAAEHGSEVEKLAASARPHVSGLGSALGAAGVFVGAVDG